MLNENVEAFVVYVASVSSKIITHLVRKAYIALFITKKVIILAEYTDFANVFLKKLAKVLFKQTDINKHTMKLVENKQPSYKLIYSLGQIKLETLKTYIETNLPNSFIWLL